MSAPRWSCLLPVLLFLPGMLGADPFRPPLFSVSSSATEGGGFYLSIEKFLPSLEMSFVPAGSSAGQGTDSEAGADAAQYSWLYSLGGSLPLLSWRPGNVHASGGVTARGSIRGVDFDVRAWMSFLSSEAPTGFWAFDASAFYSDISPRVHLLLGENEKISLRMQHSCKHDLDQARRLVIQQNIGLGWERVFVRDTDVLSLLGLSAFFDYTLPVTLPDQPANDRILALGMVSEADVLRLGPSAVLWVRAYLQGMAVRAEGAADGLAVPAGLVWRLDYQADAGIRVGSLAAFLSLRRVSDPLIEADGSGLMLFSFGVRLSNYERGRKPLENE